MCINWWRSYRDWLKVVTRVVVIEHNLDVIKTADYIIDIGPEGGDGGGTVIAQGTPEHIAQCPNSYTGIYVKKMLEKAKDNQ